MNFIIQLSNPTIESEVPTAVSDFSEAIEALFISNTEDAILIWDNIPIRLNYKYDISVIVDDLVPLLEQLSSNSEQGNHVIYFASSSFSTEWSLEWVNSLLKINSRWYTIVGNYEELLNEHGTIELTINEFLGEWKPLLQKLFNLVRRHHIKLEDPYTFKRLSKVTKNFKG